MQSIPSTMRAFGVAAAFLGLIATMLAERPTAGSLGMGIAGILAFGVSCLFKGTRGASTPLPRKEPERAQSAPASDGFAGYGLSATDDATSLHPALTAGIALPRR